jgi:hypothetical protein
MYCSGGCAASPSRAIWPWTQFMIGSRSTISPPRSGYCTKWHWGADVDHHLLLGDVVVVDLLDRHGAAVGDVGAVDRLVVDEEPAGDRVQPVGGDDDARLLDVSVMGRDPGPAVAGLQVDGGPVGEQLDADAGQRSGQDAPVPQGRARS